MRAGFAADAFEWSGKYVEQLSLFYPSPEETHPAMIERVCGTLWERRGKRLRSHLVYWFGELVGVKASELALYAWAAEAIHTATLLHDDVVDEADKRRGGPSANQLFDNTLPVISGDYLLSSALYQIASEGNAELLRLLCKTVRNLSEGESLQYQLKFTIPATIQDYVRITQLKTTSLFLWCALVGPVLSGSQRMSEVTGFMDCFGYLFQFSDDLLDVVGCSTKSKWNDLKEGKLNLVSWRLVQQSERLKVETELAFRKREVTGRLISLFEDSVQKSQRLNDLKVELQLASENAKAYLGNFPYSPTREALKELVDLCVEGCF
jgi:octaprenyl-diphosphate synthase